MVTAEDSAVGSAEDGPPVQPSTEPSTDGNVSPTPSSPEIFRCLVVDSGPIIRQTGTSQLWKRADCIFTVPAVLDEIRDAKARNHLAQLPFDIKLRNASPQGIQAIVNFAKQTGDYASFSSVDLQVLGLLYDLEREGCIDMSHIRTKPKRMVGIGNLQALGDDKATNARTAEAVSTAASVVDDDHLVSDGESMSSEALSDDETDAPKDTMPTTPQTPAPSPSAKPSSWAKIVNPEAQDEDRSVANVPSPKTADTVFGVAFGKMNLRNDIAQAGDDSGGQFGDAEDDPLSEPQSTSNGNNKSFEDELESEFPSLAAARTVPYEGSDDESKARVTTGGGEEQELVDTDARLRLEQEAEEARKKESLKPISKSGKYYNSFRKYRDLMNAKKKPADDEAAVKKESLDKVVQSTEPESGARRPKNQSRIIGGMSLAGQGMDVEDDGEGWITCTKDLHSMKASGSLGPTHNGDAGNSGTKKPNEPVGPPISQRAVCATTDFAMQNVILQMNLELISVDGIKVRKLKSWVTRCGACFKVYSSTETTTGPLGKRLFCERCGSDMMQRIAASVDGKTGRLRLHLSKRYKHNLRGTKYSLPKPGTGNRFQGDLLLREDQLLMGAWNQKAKMRSGGKARAAAKSMFGSDIAKNVGCHSNALDDRDIRVGFGRHNPNAAKGRERRGKKKKSVNKACGLRRY